MVFLFGTEKMIKMSRNISSKVLDLQKNDNKLKVSIEPID